MALAEEDVRVAREAMGQFLVSEGEDGAQSVTMDEEYGIVTIVWRNGLTVQMPHRVFRMFQASEAAEAQRGRGA